MSHVRAFAHRRLCWHCPRNRTRHSVPNAWGRSWSRRQMKYSFRRLLLRNMTLEGGINRPSPCSADTSCFIPCEISRALGPTSLISIKDRPPWAHIVLAIGAPNSGSVGHLISNMTAGGNIDESTPGFSPFSLLAGRSMVIPSQNGALSARAWTDDFEHMAKLHAPLHTGFVFKPALMHSIIEPPSRQMCPSHGFPLTASTASALSGVTVGRNKA